MVRSTIIVAVAILITVPALAQNLLVNPGFDVADQLNGWTCTTSYGVASWSSEDRLGSSESGSLVHDVTAALNNKTVWCVQCVPVNELWSYVASGWYYWPDDPDVSQTGSSRWTVYYYSDIGAMSALVYFITWQNTANEPVRARIDDLEFSTTTLFRDDFESGGVDGWSFSTP